MMAPGGTDRAGAPGPDHHRYLRVGGRGADLAPVAEVGGKAHNLARLAAAGAAVPPWIVLAAEAFVELVLEPLGTPTAEEIEAWQGRVKALKLPEDLVRALHAAVSGSRTGEGRLFAVRSSAVAEDGASASYAGQFDTRLGVPSAGLEQAVLEVWASAANPHALSYGRKKGLTPMAVLIQTMVKPTVSGVAFGADPVSGDPDAVVISAVWGLGEGLVSGELDADTYRVRGQGSAPTVEREIARKTHRLRMVEGGGTVREPLPAPLAGERATLDDERAREVAAEVRRMGEAFGEPLDVEWAIEGEGEEANLWILQARPITTLSGPGGERRVWDNSNIVESYSGVTSPLTFSFARSVYDEVYRQFCEVVGVPPALVERHRHVFANMLGLVRGRVYYNLLNWYRTLALLPGYSVNRAFMERMMGVREKLEDPPELEATSGRGADALRMGRMVARLVRQSRGLRRAVPGFHARVDGALLPLQDEDLTGWDADRLLELYRSLEEQLLRNWQTPLVNDFFAMVWFGLLGRLLERWLPGASPTLANDLLVQEGGIISAEPAARLQQLAKLARENTAVLAHFHAEPDTSRLVRRLETDPASAAFLAEIDAYLTRFGDRSMNELKLETVTLAEDPTFLFDTIRGYLDSPTSAEGGTGARLRADAEREVASRLSRGRRAVFDVVLANTRARVRDRENLRFERTRVFGVVRRIFVGMGHHLVRAGRIDSPRDVFLLRIEEILGYVDGTTTGTDLRGLVELRRREWEEYARMPAPPDRFQSIGPVSEERWIVPRASHPASPDAAGVLQGIGCCAGVVQAPVRLVRDPGDASGLRGHILVAERTDPGWTLIFPAAKGILVERGSLLSHSAIVAREMGIPCVVSIPGLMNSLRDGVRVEMDGAAGTVRRIDE